MTGQPVYLLLRLFCSDPPPVLFCRDPKATHTLRSPLAAGKSRACFQLLSMVPIKGWCMFASPYYSNLCIFQLVWYFRLCKSGAEKATQELRRVVSESVCLLCNPCLESVLIGTCTGNWLRSLMYQRLYGCSG